MYKLKLFHLLLCLLLSSCAGSWYLDTSAKQSTYTETPKNGSLQTTLSTSSGNTILISQGDDSKFETSGIGAQVGISYEGKFGVQKFQYSTISYNKINYLYSVNGASVNQGITFKSTGMTYILGLNMGSVVPRASLKSESQTTTTDGDLVSTTTTESQYFLGYGLEFKIGIGKNFQAYLSYDNNFKVNKDPAYNINTTEIAIGVNYRPFKGKGSKKKSGLFPFFRVFK